MIIFASWARASSTNSISTHSDSTVVYFNIILNNMKVLALGPLALPQLKISAHWEGVQQMSPVHIVVAGAAWQWLVGTTTCWH